MYGRRLNCVQPLNYNRIMGFDVLSGATGIKTTGVLTLLSSNKVLDRRNVSSVTD